MTFWSKLAPEDWVLFGLIAFGVVFNLHRAIVARIETAYRPDDLMDMYCIVILMFAGAGLLLFCLMMH